MNRKDNADGIKRLIINPLINIPAGIGAGYGLEKTGTSYSEIDYAMQMALPVMVDSFQSLYREITGQEKISSIDHLASLGMGGFAYGIGNVIGRTLAKIN